MKKPNVLWQANSDVQRAFLACSARTAMTGGGAGGGKTSALLAAAAQQSGNPEHRAVIFRRDYPSLRQIISKSMALFVPMRGQYNKSEHVWQFPSGSTLTFSHLDDESAVYQHSGQEYSFIGYDEVQQLPGDAVDSKGQPINSAFTFMQSRLRAPVGSGLRLEVRCTATPHGVGSAWVKSYFRIPDSGESCEFVDEATGFRRAYFKSVAADNPALDKDYHLQFVDMPEAQRKALLKGDWTAHIGQVFSEWDYRAHVCLPFPVPCEWEVWRGADDGFAAPAAVVWLAFDEIHDRVYVVSELYRSGMTPEVFAGAVKRIDMSIPVNLGNGEVIDNDMELDGVIDSASFANVGMGGGRADMMNALGCKWKPCEKGPDSRRAGIDAVHARLAVKGDGRPGLIVFSTCRELIRTLPAAVYSRTKPEDIDERCEQHLVDALRYGLGRKKRSAWLTPVRGI